MPHLNSMSGLALIGGIGAILGAYLGRDAVDQIDPVFFSPLPETHFYADDTPQGYSLGEPDPMPAEHLWWNAVPKGPCLNCTDNFIDPVFASAPSDLPRWDQLREVRHEGGREAASLDAEVERYASFPITREEAQIQTIRRERYAEQAAPPSESAEGDSEAVGM